MAKKLLKIGSSVSEISGIEIGTEEEIKAHTAKEAKPVSGVKDGDNWTSITIGEDTGNIPAGGGTTVEASTQLVTGAVTANSLKIGNTDYNLPQPAQVLPNYLNKKYEKVAGSCEIESAEQTNVQFTVTQPVSREHTFIVINKTKNLKLFGEPASYYQPPVPEAEVNEDGGACYIISTLGFGAEKHQSTACFFENWVDFVEDEINDESGHKYQLQLAGTWRQCPDGKTWEDTDEIEVECITCNVPFIRG